MNVNKKLDRLKHWAGERMGGDVRTTVSDEFKTLEVEMGLRYDGMKANQNAMNAYVKSISKRNDGEEKEKILPIGCMGSAMANHGEDFEPDSEFGQCLVAMGRSNERIGRIQEGYISRASSSWLDSSERSVAQMKEYQTARKKLDSRRLAYDTAAAKMEKAKREDFRSEEELRSQKAKYDEASEDVYRRMMDIKEAEADSVLDLTEFLDAELDYYERCREVLLQLKRDWPAGRNEPSRKVIKSRSNTATYNRDPYYNSSEETEVAPPQPPRPSVRSNRVISGSVPQSPTKELPSLDFRPGRPAVNRSVTYDITNQVRDSSPASSYSMHRVPSDSMSIRNQRSQLRPVSRVVTDGVVDNSDASTYYSNDTNSPDRMADDANSSPTTSYGSLPSRTFSSGTLSAMTGGKKAPPPPPPSRTKKPPPPPPPMRRAANSSFT